MLVQDLRENKCGAENSQGKREPDRRQQKLGIKMLLGRILLVSDSIERLLLCAVFGWVGKYVTNKVCLVLVKGGHFVVRSRNFSDGFLSYFRVDDDIFFVGCRFQSIYDFIDDTVNHNFRLLLRLVYLRDGRR